MKRSVIFLALLSGLWLVSCDDSSSNSNNTNNLQCSPTCDTNATCTDQGEGSMGCLCNDGYTGDGLTCTDIDECATGTANCDVNATCTNTDGSFLCECNLPYTGNGIVCTEPTDCTNDPDICGTNATCTDQGEGSMVCQCNEGYTGDGLTCTDIDECTNGTANCDVNATCTNIDGSFLCECNTGWEGDGTACTDIDECTTGTANCDVNATCTNTVGSFLCECNTGFTGDGLTCTDIDECVDTCSPNATCTNIAGSYSCICNSGFTGDGLTCTDIDECTTGTANCDVNATCTNTDGSFLCECPYSLDDVYGNGTLCDFYASCASIVNAQGAGLPDGLYTIDAGMGPVQVFCDMTTDGGIGYTMKRVDDTDILFNNQTPYFNVCADLGMEVIVPRNRAHALAIKAWNGGVAPNIINVFPDYNGAVGLHNWSGRCQGAPCDFWISNSNKALCTGNEPSGDNNIGNAIVKYGGTDGSCDYGMWNDANNVVYEQGWVICSTNDAAPPIPASCRQALLAGQVFNNSQNGISGTYTIETSAGHVQVYCDMHTDGGIGYTMKRVDDATNLLNSQAPYFNACADLGMEVIVPRNRSHALAIKAWNGGVAPNIINVFPDYNGAVGLHNWSGRCQGAPCDFWISNSNNAYCTGSEPSGDNNTANAIIKYIDTGCDYGLWYDANDTIYEQGWVICSTNDVAPTPTTCAQAYWNRWVSNKSSTGISGIYAIDPQGNGTTIDALCDFSTSNGGWTLVANLAQNDVFDGTWGVTEIGTPSTADKYTMAFNNLPEVDSMMMRYNENDSFFTRNFIPESPTWYNQPSPGIGKRRQVSTTQTLPEYLVLSEYEPTYGGLYAVHNVNDGYNTDGDSNQSYGTGIFNGLAGDELCGAIDHSAWKPNPGTDYTDLVCAAGIFLPGYFSLWFRDLFIETFEQNYFRSMWSFSGNGWEITKDEPISGTYSAKSRPIHDYEYTKMTMSIFCPEVGSVTFNYSVSSEQYGDTLEFRASDSIYGLGPSSIWHGEQSGIYNADLWVAGTHTVEFIYRKNQSLSGGSDSARIDNIMLHGCVPVIP